MNTHWIKKVFSNRKISITGAAVICFLLLAFVISGIFASGNRKSKEVRSNPSSTATASASRQFTGISPTISAITAAPTAPADSPTPSPVPTAYPPTPTLKFMPLVTNTPPPPSADNVPPTLDYISGPGDGSTVSFRSFCFPMKFSDNNGSDTQNISVKSGFDNSWTDWGKEFAPCFQNVAEGVHTFSAQAKDGIGNMTQVYTRTFTVNSSQNQVNAPTQTVEPTALPSP